VDQTLIRANPQATDLRASGGWCHHHHHWSVSRYGVIMAVIVLQLGFTYLPPMQQLFATHGLSFVELLIVAGVGVSVLMVLELEKLVLRWRHIKT
jgi:hypothetical protein